MIVDRYSLTAALPRLKNIVDNPQKVRGGKKFGRNPVVGSTALETAWPVGGLYPWQDNAQEMFAASTDGTDAGDVLVWGTDENHRYSPTRVTIDGQNPVSIGSSYVNLERARSFALFAGDINVGFGLFTGGEPETTMLRISAGEGSTKMGVGVVPSGTIGLLAGYRATATKACRVIVAVTPLGAAPWDLIDEQLGDVGSSENNFLVPDSGPGLDDAGELLLYKAGTRLDLLAKSNTSPASVTMEVEFILVIMD